MERHDMSTDPAQRTPDPNEEILYSRSAAPSPEPIVTAPVAPRPRRSLAGPLLAVTLVASTVAGGLVGGLAASQWLAPSGTSKPAIATEAPATSPSSPSEVAATTGAGATVASSVYARVNGSVVHLAVSGSASGRGNGSGFVVSDRGYILTNQHVVAGARTILARFSTGETRPATVVGTDRGNDLALLQVELPAGVAAVTLGDSDEVEPGELAIAIGSPFGLDQTVTQGIISAVGRTWQPSGQPMRRDLIQTDAPINPGNSGGPLLNADGEVIGVNSMIESPVEGSVGIGFAVAINVAKDLLPELQTGAQNEPVWLGISGIAIDQDIADDLGLGVSSGVLVASVIENGPAAKAGVRGGDPDSGDIPRGGDVIVALDGVAVASVPDISSRLRGRKPGDTVTLTILRDGERIDLRVTLEVWPAETN